MAIKQISVAIKETRKKIHISNSKNNYWSGFLVIWTMCPGILDMTKILLNEYFIMPLLS